MISDSVRANYEVVVLILTLLNHNQAS